MSLLATLSIAGGLFEALLLVLVSRLGFAITDGAEDVETIAGRNMAISSGIVFALSLVAARASVAVLAAWQSARLSTRVIADNRTRLARAYLRSTWTQQHGERAGRLQELLTTFSAQGAVIVDNVIKAIGNGFSLFALLLMAVLVDPVASVAVIVVIAALALVVRPIRGAIRRQASSTATTGMNFATSLSEISQMTLEMHIFNVQSQTEMRTEELIARNAAATRKLSFLRTVVPSIYVSLAFLALIGGLGLAAAFDAANSVSLGAILLIMLRSMSYGQGLQTSSVAIGASLPFLDTLQSELDRYESSRLVDHGVPVERVGQLVLENVSFEYSPGVPVLTAISFAMREREVVGIVGPSGSGKSTLVQLLLALRNPTTGRVLADGRDIRTFSKSEWARKVTFVPQQAHLVAGTVADNIRFLRDGITMEQIEEASRLANLHGDVVGFTEGYDRQVGEQGSHLSGGQQQRLIIARALVEDPDVLILDEPTSSLDARSEHLIRNTLDALRERMMIVVIAHRLSTLSICDRIMVIQDGELRGFDTPENLEQSSDFYREALILSGMM